MLAQPLLDSSAYAASGAPRPLDMSCFGTQQCHSPPSSSRAVEVHGPELLQGTVSWEGSSVADGDALAQRVHAAAFSANLVLLMVRACQSVSHILALRRQCSTDTATQKPASSLAAALVGSSASVSTKCHSWPRQVKLWCFLESGSIAVLASLVDSVVDLAAQSVLWAASRVKMMSDPWYPAGRARLEPVGVIACALLMTLASAAVVHEAFDDLLQSSAGHPVTLVQLSWVDLFMLSLTVALKLLLYFWCKRAVASTHNVTIGSLAQDALNDVLSNAAAIVAAGLTQLSPKLWVSEPKSCL